MLVVGPKRDREPVPLIDTRLHSRLKTRHGALYLSKPSSNLNFSLELLEPGECHSGKDVARQQAQSELVRIVQNPRVGDCQIQLQGDLHGCTYPTHDVWRLHLESFSPDVHTDRRMSASLASDNSASQPTSRAGRRRLRADPRRGWARR